MTLIFLSLGWLAGLLIGQAYASELGPAARDLPVGAWLAGLAALGGLSAWLSGADSRLRSLSLLLAMALLGASRVFFLLPADLDAFGTDVRRTTVHGTISGRPEPRDSSLSLVLEVDAMDVKGVREPVRGQLLVRTDRYQQWSYGDRVSAWGEIRPVRGQSGYWAEYLARRGIQATMEYPRLRLQASAEGWDPLRWINSARDRLDEVCAALLPEPQGSLLAGILVGSRSAMPAEFAEALNATSTSHIVAVSGFNVTLVAGLSLAAAVRIWSRRRAVLLAIGAVWFYTVMTGLPPSAVRAAIMGTMMLVATLLGRGGDALSFLCLSAALMAGLDPRLLQDLGFQLSFLSTAGLILLEPVLRRGLGWAPGWLASPLSVTLAAQLATLPVLVNSFHSLSLISPLSNLLIAPALPGLMVVGIVVAGAGMAAEQLGQMLAPLALLFLTYLVEVIQRTADLPGAGLSTGALEPYVVGLYYLGLLAISLWPLPEFRGLRAGLGAGLAALPRWTWAGALVAILSLGALGIASRSDGKLHLYFLDVGQGDAALVVGPSGHRVLIDGGPSPGAITGSLGGRLGLMDRGVDAILVTSYAEDRVAGAVEVVRRYPVGMVVQPPLPEAKGIIGAWGDLLRDRNVLVVEGREGQRIELGDESYLEVILARGGAEEGDRGMALRLVSHGVGVLLPGDLSRGAQRELAERRPGRVELLWVPRHGAAGALDEGLLQAVSPRAAVLSVKADNRLGQPADSTVAMLRNSAIYRTDRDGTIEAAIGPAGYELFVEK